MSRARHHCQLDPHQSGLSSRQMMILRQINLNRIRPITATAIHCRMTGDVAEGKRIIAGITVQMVATARAVDSIGTT